MTGDLADLRRWVWHELVDSPGILTREAIREAIAMFRPLSAGVTDDQAEDLAIEIEERRGVLLTPARALARKFKPWLNSRTGEIDWHYWQRYQEFLIHQKQLAPEVVAEIDKDTNRIVGYLEDPAKIGRWDRRGMVMGHVQSGKTGNYIGVATKAADAGYRVVIIMAGVQNRLRDQTQQRVDEGFVGYDTGAGIGASGRVSVGVGRSGSSSRQPTTFTTTIRDFHRTVAEQVGIPIKNLLEPVVFVIKKNPHTLRNLIEWLRTHNAHHLHSSTIVEPMLLIDDTTGSKRFLMGMPTCSATVLWKSLIVVVKVVGCRDELPDLPTPNGDSTRGAYPRAGVVSNKSLVHPLLRLVTKPVLDPGHDDDHSVPGVCGLCGDANVVSRLT